MRRPPQIATFMLSNMVRLGGRCSWIKTGRNYSSTPTVFQSIASNILAATKRIEMQTWPAVAMLAILTLASPAMAQDAGGVRLAPGSNGGPVGLARPLPFTRIPLVTARDLQGGSTPADRTAQNQAAIAHMRGDPGFLTGFAAGTPLAASRQGPGPLGDQADPDQHHRGGGRPIIINNQGPLAVTVGNGNVVQQQSATGSGPIAQQQVATTSKAGASGSGATNLVTAGGNIVQRVPGAH
jgi:hypothetical protein